MLCLCSWAIIVGLCSAFVFADIGCDVAAAQTITLDEAIARALETAPPIESAEAQSELNTARVGETFAPLLPWIAANGEYYQPSGYDNTITNGGLTEAQLALTYTAFDGGRRLAQLRAARYAAEAATLGIKAAHAQVVFDTSVAYFDLLRERQTEAELQSSLSRLSRYVRIVKALQRSGRAIVNDVLTLQMTRDAAELSLAASRQAVAQASIVLGSLIGGFGNTSLVPVEISGLPSLPPGNFSHNPAYQAAARQLQSAKLSVEAARDERYPNLNLTLTTGWLGINPPKTFGHHFGASYDGAVSVPIFQGDLIRSHIDSASADELAARAQQRQIELQVKRDLAEASVRYRGAVDQLLILRRSRQSAADVFALDWTRFLGGGNVSVLEVTNAYQQAENLKVACLDQEFNARQAAAQERMLLGLQ